MDWNALFAAVYPGVDVSMIRNAYFEMKEVRSLSFVLVSCNDLAMQETKYED